MGDLLRTDIDLPSGGDDAYTTLTSEAAPVSPGAEGLLFLPYLTGERTPHNDPAARGVFSGLGQFSRNSRDHNVMLRQLRNGMCCV